MQVYQNPYAYPENDLHFQHKFTKENKTLLKVAIASVCIICALITEDPKGSYKPLAALIYVVGSFYALRTTCKILWERYQCDIMGPRNTPQHQRQYSEFLHEKGLI